LFTPQKLRQTADFVSLRLVKLPKALEKITFILAIGNRLCCSHWIYSYWKCTIWQCPNI